MKRSIRASAITLSLVSFILLSGTVARSGPSAPDTGRPMADTGHHDQHAERRADPDDRMDGKGERIDPLEASIVRDTSAGRDAGRKKVDLPGARPPLRDVISDHPKFLEALQAEVTTAGGSAPSGSLPTA